jgi:dihydroorotate dehydrogenase electron transfer subunit
MRIVEIKAVKDENPNVRTLFFTDDLCSSAKAGQFVMVWIPGVDEIPLTLSSIGSKSSGRPSSVTVAEVGEATRALKCMETGELIGVRGPFGNHFETVGRSHRVLVVGGGIGMASLMPLIERLAEEGVETTVLLGVKSRRNLLFAERLSGLSSQDGIRLLVTTEDGTYGAKGLVTEAAENVLSSERFDMVYSCGPEAMMRKIFNMAEEHGIPAQLSLERIIRCAIGICGSCVLGPYRVCKDGPVFTSDQLRTVRDFGRFKRGFDGRKTPV